jgi:hypothetical protein
MIAQPYVSIIPANGIGVVNSMHFNLSFLSRHKPTPLRQKIRSSAELGA